MTQSRWLAACAAVLLLGGNTARSQAQCCLPCQPCSAQPSEAARVPFYNELPQILFPAQATALAPNSNPVVWASLFEAVAGNRCQSCAPCQANAPSSPCERGRRASVELLKMYRFYYRTGHYHAAAFMAGRALQFDPSNVAAEAALDMARLAADAIDRCGGLCDDAEDCEQIPPPARACAGACGVSAPPAVACGMCVGAAVMSEGCPSAARPCCTRASCACGESCKCADDEPCACGEKCCCKKAGRQDVRTRAVPNVLVIQIPAMMCPPCPVCPGFQAALPHPAQAVMPHPMPGMMPPAPPMFPQPPMNVMVPNMSCTPGMAAPCWGAATGPCMAWRPACAAEQLPPPRLVSGPVPGMGLMCGTASTPAPDAMRIAVCGKQINLTCPPLKACCDSVTALPDGRALLEGNVTVTFTREDRPAKIKAMRMIVDLEDGSYEVSPPLAPAPALKPVSFKECCPDAGKPCCPFAKKKLFYPCDVCPIDCVPFGCSKPCKACPDR